MRYYVACIPSADTRGQAGLRGNYSVSVWSLYPRQKDRERSGNIIEVNCNKNEITNAIKLALYDKKFKDEVKKIKNVYGEGKTSKLIITNIKKYFSIC